MSRNTKIRYKLKHAVNGFEKGQLFESKDDVTDKILERVEIPIDVEDAVNRLIDQAMYRPYYHNDMRGADDTRELGNIVKRALGIKT